MRGVIRKNDSAKQANLIGRLNPVILGWAKRRHPKKFTAWIVDRYWHRLGTRRYFAVMAGSKTRQGRAMVSYLIDPRKIPIERHIKVKSNANPFDSQWSGYFESRKKLQKAHDDR